MQGSPQRVPEDRRGGGRGRDTLSAARSGLGRRTPCDTLQAQAVTPRRNETYTVTWGRGVLSRIPLGCRQPHRQVRWRLGTGSLFSPESELQQKGLKLDMKGDVLSGEHPRGTLPSRLWNFLTVKRPDSCLGIRLPRGRGLVPRTSEGPFRFQMSMRIKCLNVRLRGPGLSPVGGMTPEDPA